MGEFINFLGNSYVTLDIYGFCQYYCWSYRNGLMVYSSLLIAVSQEFEPMLLIISCGILIHIPFNMEAGLKVGIYEKVLFLIFYIRSYLRMVSTTYLFRYRCNDTISRH